MKTFILPTLFALIPLLAATSSHSQSPAFITPEFITGQRDCHDYWPGFTADGNSVIFSKLHCCPCPPHFLKHRRPEGINTPECCKLFAELYKEKPPLPATFTLWKGLPRQNASSCIY